MRYLILVLAMVLGCAAEGVEPTVQIGGYGSDITAPDIQGVDTQGTDVEGSDVGGTDVVQPDVQDTLGTDIEGVDIQVDAQPDVQVDKDVQDAQVDVQDAQPDVQIDTQPDTQQPDVQDVQAEVQDAQPDVQDVQDTQVDTQPDVGGQDTKPQGGCINNWDCDDGNACTQDYCTAKKCGHTTEDGVQCDDGNPCTLWDSCKSDTCMPGAVCDDSNPCTVDACENAACTHKPSPKFYPCWEGCAKGTCQKSSTGGMVCDILTLIPNCNDDNPCTKDACLNQTECTHTPCKEGECVSSNCKSP